MSKFIEKLKEGTKKTLSTITGKAKDYMREQQQESIRMQRIQQNEAVYNFMCRIQYALFTAFHGKNYGLAPLHTCGGIRIVRYAIINQRYIYYFSMAKSSPDVLPPYILASIRNNMNTDLHQATVMQRQGYSVILPLLANGMVVVDVQDKGGQDILIGVILK